MTKLGVLAIDEVDVVSEYEVSEIDARDAGFASKEELFSYLFEAQARHQAIPQYRLR